MYPLLYHGTSEANARSILREGLHVNRIGIAYLSPRPDVAAQFGAVVLVVHVPENIRLSFFEDCADWEILCWGTVPPNSIERYTPVAV